MLDSKIKFRVDLGVFWAADDQFAILQSKEGWFSIYVCTKYSSWKIGCTVFF